MSNVNLKSLPYSLSLYRLFWLAFFLVAILPTLLVSFLLSDRVVEQSREQVNKSLSHKVEIQAELIERELNQQFLSLQQLSKVSDVALTPSSSIFGYQAGIHLNHFIEQSPTASALYILDREHWAIEVAPLSAELVQLDTISPKVEQYLKQVEISQEIEPLIFYLEDAAMVSILTSHMNPPPKKKASNWLMVIALPLTQGTQYAKTKFKVVGSLIYIQPFEFLSPLLSRWQPKDGALALFDGNKLLVTSSTINDFEHSISLDSDITLNEGNKTLILRNTEPLDSLQAIVFEDVWRLGLLISAILMMVLFIAFYISRLVKVQLSKLTRQVKAFATGDYQFRVSGLRFSEFIQVSSVLEQLSTKVITDQSQLEQKVGERTKELELVNTELSSTLEALQETQDKLLQSEKMASLGQMMSGIAHELNTPLGICVTAVGLVEESGQNLIKIIDSGAIKKSELKTQLDTLSTAGHLISRNIRRSSDLVSLFKELSLDSEIEDKNQFELSSFLQTLSDVWLATHGNEHLKIITSGDTLYINSYIGTLRRVLAILFDNAQTHAFANSGQGKVEISCRKIKETVEIIFSDNGPGVNIEPISRIFEPFYTSGRGGGNVGLGLHLAYNLVTQRLNGDIIAQNREQGGLQITLKLASQSV